MIRNGPICVRPRILNRVNAPMSKLGKPVYDRFHVISRPPMHLQSASESFYGELIKYQEWESPCNPFQLTIWYTNDIVEDVDYWEGNQEGARSYRASAKQGAKP